MSETIPGTADSDSLEPYQVHHAQSQRLDARLVAKLYGMSLIRLALACDLKYNTLKKTPDAPNAQENLGKLVEAWDILIAAVSTTDAVKRWINHPSRTMRGKTPRSILNKDNGVNEFLGFVYNEAKLRRVVDPATTIYRHRLSEEEHHG